MDKETEQAIDRMDEDEVRYHAKELEKEIDNMRAEKQPTTMTAEIAPMNSVKLSINAKGQLTGEVKAYGNDLMADFINAKQIIEVIVRKNKETESL